ALGGTEREVMLDAIALEHRDRAVVAMDWTGDGERPLRQQQAVALVGGDCEMIGDHGELVHRHVEYRPGIHGHRCLPWSRCQELRAAVAVGAARRADDALGRS